MPNYKKQRPEWVAATQCQGKHRFADGGLAKQVAKQASARKDGRVSAYRCHTCGGWHIGNSNHRAHESRKPRPPERYDE